MFRKNSKQNILQTAFVAWGCHWETEVPGGVDPFAKDLHVVQAPIKTEHEGFQIIMKVAGMVMREGPAFGATDVFKSKPVLKQNIHKFHWLYGFRTGQEGETESCPDKLV